MKKSVPKSLKVIHIALCLALVGGFIYAIVVHSSNAAQLSSLRDGQINLDDLRAFDLKATHCAMPGCDAEKVYDLSYSFQNSNAQQVVYDIPNRANFTVSSEGYTDVETGTYSETNDVYYVSDQGGGDYTVYKDEVTTKKEVETDRRQMYKTRFSGSYCSDHAKEAVGILADELEDYLNQDIVYWLCLGSMPYNLIAVPALMVLLYYLFRILPIDIDSYKKIKHGKATFNKEKGKRELKANLKSALIMLLIFVLLSFALKTAMQIESEFWNMYVSFFLGIVCAYLLAYMIWALAGVFGDALLGSAVPKQKEEQVN